jgi:hypothetical protein
MANVALPGIPIRTFDDFTSVTHGISNTGHKIFTVGTLVLASGPGTSKTLSSAGGKIIVRTATTVFANAGTTLRVGYQDVNTATGLPDGTFDTYVDLVGGGGGFPSNAYVPCTLASGSKTVADGDLISLGIEFTARAGADSAQVIVVSDPTGRRYVYPYTVRNGGFGDSKDRETAIISLVTDDGTAGWIVPISCGAYSLTALTLNSGSTPDEYAAVFTTLVPMQFNKMGMLLGGIGTSDTFDWALYSDPLGTPVVIDSDSVNPQVLGSQFGPFEWWGTIPAQTLAPGTYGFSVRPTSGNNIDIYYQDLGAGMEILKAPTFFGTSLKLAGRTNQTGAFVETDADHIPSFLFNICGLSDGAGGGGGTRAYGGIG